MNSLIDGANEIINTLLTQKKERQKLKTDSTMETYNKEVNLNPNTSIIILD